MAAHDKKVDEDWKRKARHEKEVAQDKDEPTPAPAGAPMDDEPSILAIVSSLAMQALICLGRQPDPASGQTVKDLGQARFCIDLLGILEEKTRGNLTEEEAKAIEGTLHELRMLFVDSAMPDKGEAGKVVAE